MTANTTPADHLGWAAHGLWSWLDGRDQDVPLRLDELCTSRDGRDAVRTLVTRLEAAGWLRRERAVQPFGTGTAWLYRTRD